MDGRTRRTKKLRWLIGALAAAAVLAPAAMATSSVALPDGLAVAKPAALGDGVRLGQIADGLRYTALADAYGRGVDTSGVPRVNADALRYQAIADAYRHRESALSSPAQTRQGRQHDERVALPIAQPELVASSSSGFDWGSAAIGGGVAAFFAAMAVLGAVLLVSRRRILHA